MRDDNVTRDIINGTYLIVTLKQLNSNFLNNSKHWIFLIQNGTCICQVYRDMFGAASMHFNALQWSECTIESLIPFNNDFSGVELETSNPVQRFQSTSIKRALQTQQQQKKRKTACFNVFWVEFK